MKDILGKVVMIEVSAEGYYSGQSESHVAFLSVEDYEKAKETIDNASCYFHELDGKHSEIEGNITVTLIKDAKTLKHCIQSWHNCDDSYQVWDSCLDGANIDIEQAIDFDAKVTGKMEARTPETIYYYKGVGL